MCFSILIPHSILIFNALIDLCKKNVYVTRRFLDAESLLSVPLLTDFRISIFFLPITGVGAAGAGAAATGAGDGVDVGTDTFDTFDFWELDSCEWQMAGLNGITRTI